MRKLIGICLFGLSAAAGGQEIEPFLREFADGLMKESRIEFVELETGKVVEVTNGMKPMRGLAVGSGCANWHYTSSLLCDAFYALGKELDDEAYSKFVLENHRFLFDHMDFIKQSNARKKTRVIGIHNIGRYGGVWTCGPQGGAVLNSYLRNKDPEYLNCVREIADHLKQLRQREEPGSETQSHHQGLDGVYAHVATMARLGALTGESRYFDFCVDVMKETDRYYDPGTKLYAQSYFPDLKVTNQFYWLRGIGWTAVAFAELLSHLPEDHPGYEEVLSRYQKLMIGVAPHQSRNGLWRHLVNRTDAFEETSGSAFLVYAFAKGVNEGWLPDRYRDVAMTGWRGIMSMRNDDGSFRGVTGSTRTGITAAYFLNNSTEDAEQYLHGPLLLAGVEMLKMYKNPEYRKPSTRRWTFSHDVGAVNEATN